MMTRRRRPRQAAMLARASRENWETRRCMEVVDARLGGAAAAGGFMGNSQSRDKKCAPPGGRLRSSRHRMWVQRPQPARTAKWRNTR